MILAIGNINMDWICIVPHLPIPDEKINISQLSIFPGGAASNFAVSLARLGSAVAIFGHVGDDAEGQEALRALTEEKVDTSRVKRESKLHTGFVIILVGEEGQSMKLRFLGANTKLSPTDISPKLLKGIDLVYLASIKLPIAQRVANVCKELGIQTAIDVGGELLTQPKKKIRNLICRYSIVFMNEVVFTKLYGKAPTKATVHAEVRDNLEVLNVTLGRRGSLAATPSDIIHTPIFKVKSVDTTGAGDAFAAGFLHYYQQKLQLSEVVKRASACAAMQITQPGGRAGLPTASEVECFMKSLNR